tara:strand:- start:1963 stop:2145 length:183 start_codon:yes stop_codon:yes gene_type:complete
LFCRWFFTKKNFLGTASPSEYNGKVRIIFSFIEDKGWFDAVKKRDGLFFPTRANYSLNKM